MRFGNGALGGLLGIGVLFSGLAWSAAQEPTSAEAPPLGPNVQTPLDLPGPLAVDKAPGRWQDEVRRRAMFARRAGEAPAPGPNPWQAPSDALLLPVDRAFTGPQGQVHTYQRSLTDQGLQTHQSFVGPQGQTRTMDRTITPEGASWERTFTGPQGQTHTFQREVTGDSVHMQGTITNPSGQTRSFDRTFTREPMAPATETGAPPAAPDARPAAPRRSGFTVGSARRIGWGWGRSVGAEARAAQVQTPGQRARLWHPDPGSAPGRGMSNLRSGGRR